VGTYAVRRLLLAIPVLVLVSFGAFALLRLVPGSAAELRAGAGQNEADVKRLEHQFGLDEPIPVQYVQWVGRVFSGDLGESIWTTEPVSDEIKRRFGPTFELTVLAAILAVLVAIPAGTLAALHQDRWPDRSLQVFTALGLAIPNFVIATLVIALPALWGGWTPPTGHVRFFDGPADNLQRMILPAVIVGLAQVALMTRLTRSALLEVLRQDYVRTAKAKGLAMRTVVIQHALRNAMLPVLTVFGLQFATLLGGAVVIETIFTIPGMGTGVLTAINRRDYNLAQTLVLIFAVIHVVSIFVTDIAYVLVDPRIRY
jgi:peptide/nickel transport system permease protein